MCIGVESLHVGNMVDKEKADGFFNHFFVPLQFGFTLPFLMKMFFDNTDRNIFLDYMLYCQHSV